MSQSKVKKNNELTLEQKREIIIFKQSNPKIKNVNIAKIYAKKFQVRIPESTLSGFIYNHKLLKDEIANEYRSTEARFPELEKALFIWFCDMRRRHISVSSDMLVEKAKIFAELLCSRLETENFKFSAGWISKFKARYKITCRTIQGESGSVDENYIKIEREKLKKVTATYSRDDIYNLDETALFFKLQPNKTLSNGDASGEKISKDRLTIALCCNATGSDKLKPIIIHKYAKPHCFGGSYNPNVYSYYYHNKKAWMTSLIFTDWLEKFNNFIKLKNPSRKVLLLVDNASGHNLTYLELSNVKVAYLPPNATSVLQPCDAGIIKTFKGYYRKNLVRHLIETIEQLDKVVLPDVKQAIKMITFAWRCVSSDTIENCWSHCDILDKKSDELVEPAKHPETESDSIVCSLQELLEDLKNKYSYKKKDTYEVMSAVEFIEEDKNEPTGDLLEDSDIIELAKEKEDQEPIQEIEEVVQEPVNYSSKFALEGLDRCFLYFENLPIAEDEDINLLFQVKNRLLELKEKSKVQSSLFNFLSH
jgi:hypothetical protein